MHFRDLLRLPISNWSLQCKRILSQRHAPLCQHALKKGQTPKPLRGELWSYVLGSHSFVNVCTTFCYLLSLFHKFHFNIFFFFSYPSVEFALLGKIKEFRFDD